MTAGVNLALNLLLVGSMGLYGVILSTVAATAIVGMPWLLHNLFTTLFDGEDCVAYLGTMAFYGGMTFFNCILTYGVCSQIPAEEILGLAERAVVCLFTSNILFLLCYGGRKDFRQLLTLGKRFLPEIHRDKAVPATGRSAEKTTKG